MKKHNIKLDVKRLDTLSNTTTDNAFTQVTNKLKEKIKELDKIKQVLMLKN